MINNRGNQFNYVICQTFNVYKDNKNTDFYSNILYSL